MSTRGDDVSVRALPLYSRPIYRLCDTVRNGSRYISGILFLSRLGPFHFLLLFIFIWRPPSFGDIRNIIFSFSFRVRDCDICHFQLSALSLVTRKFRQLVYTNSRKRFFLFVGHSGEKKEQKKKVTQFE